MNIPKEQCNPGYDKFYKDILNQFNKTIGKSVEDYITDFENIKKQYTNNNDIISILSNAINIFNIIDYEYRYKLSNYLYIKIITFLKSNHNYDISFIDNLISSYTYFEKCLDKDKEQVRKNLNNIILYLNKIKISLNEIKHQPEIKEFKDIITTYIKKDIPIVINHDDNIKIEEYCSNIIFLINEIKTTKIIKEFKELINTPKTIEVKEVKKKSFSTFLSKLNFSGKTNQSTIYNTDNYFIMFYKNILEIYKTTIHCDYNNETDECINIKKLLFYIAKLYHKSKELNNHITTYDDEPPNIDTLNVFLAIKFGGKNKNEFINYKFENKVYRRKVRYDGKKKYIILDKTRIYIKK